MSDDCFECRKCHKLVRAPGEAGEWKEAKCQHCGTRTTYMIQLGADPSMNKTENRRRM